MPIVSSLDTVVLAPETCPRSSPITPTRSHHVKPIAERLGANSIFKDLKRGEYFTILWCETPGRRKRRKLALHNGPVLIRAARFGLRRRRGVGRHQHNRSYTDFLIWKVRILQNGSNEVVEGRFRVRGDCGTILLMICVRSCPDLPRTRIRLALNSHSNSLPRYMIV